MSKTKIITTALKIRGLELHVHLGWPDNERHEAQTIWIDVNISFSEPPAACLSDDLKDTLCYSTLIKQIQTHIADKSFHLIEHVTYEIYQLVKSVVAEKGKVSVLLTKHPKIFGLTDGITFGYWDD